MGLKHILLSTKSVVIVLVAFAIVVFVRLAWTDWSGDFTLPFLRTGRIEELAILFLVGAIVAALLTKLLQWTLHAEAKPRRRRS